jgi:hypothetical protein
MNRASTSTETPMQPELTGMLTAIEAGDTAVLGMLADWLEERGDPRALLARQAATIDVELVADTLYWMRGGITSKGEAINAIVDTLIIGVPLGADPSVSRQDCRSDVRTAIERKRLPSDVARAITLARRTKVDRLFQQFKETPAAP